MLVLPVQEVYCSCANIGQIVWLFVDGAFDVCHAGSVFETNPHAMSWSTLAGNTIVLTLIGINWPRTQVHNMLRKYQQEANNIFMFLLIFFFFHQGYGHGSLKIYACHNASWVLCSSIMFLEFCVQVQLYRYLTDLMIYVMFITLYLFYHSYIFIWINTRTA